MALLDERPRAPRLSPQRGEPLGIQESADHLRDLDRVARMSREELEAHAKALRTILLITDALLEVSDPREVPARAVDAIARFTHFPGVAIFDLDEAAERLVLIGSRGFGEAAVQTARHLPLRDSLTGVAVSRRELVTSDDVGRDPRTTPRVREELAKEGFTGIASVPLVAGDRVLGAMNLIYKGAIGLSPRERDLIVSIAKVLSTSLERLRYMRRTQESEQRFATTLESIGDGVIATDTKGVVTFVNHEAERLTAWVRDQAIGRPLVEIFRTVGKQTDATAESPVARSLRDGVAVRLPDEMSLVDRNGDVHAIADSCAPIRVERGGGVSGAVLVFRDVTEARRAEQWRSFLSEASVVLASSLDYEATLAEVARLAVVSLADWCLVDMVQPDGTIRRLAGVHTDPAKQPLVDALVRGTRFDPDSRGGVARAIRSGRPVVLSDICDEAERLFSEIGLRAFMCVPLPARGKVLGAMSFGSQDARRFGDRDVERAEELAQRCALAIDNARLYREACDAVVAREEFLSVASHELRTPVQALQLTLRALERAGPPALGSLLSRASKQVDRLNGLIESLLTVSRIATGQFTPVLEELDLGELVARVASRCEQEVRRARSTLHVEIELVRVRCDRAKIEQAIANLLANAIKYGAGKPIEIEVGTLGAMARVTVTDHGIGIGKDDVGRVFDRFERAVSVRQYGGLGLGLYIARGIAEAHGGKITVTSQPGAGSSFSLLLPLPKDDSPGAR
jgi:PAS domain S-box-containing protein